MITCVVHYTIDPAKIEDFERFARRWIDLVNRHGGTHHGYFLGDPPQIAYLHGFHHGLNIAALLALTGAIVALATIRNRPAPPTPGQSPRPSTRRSAKA